MQRVLSGLIMNKKVLVLLCMLFLALMSEAPVDAQVIGIPISLSYQAPIEFPVLSAPAVLRRLDIDGSLQILGSVSDSVFIGGEVGLSLSVPVIATVVTGAISIGIAPTILIASSLQYRYAHAGHIPLRILTNFRINEHFDIDVYTGVNFNFVASVEEHSEMTVDVGTRFYVANFFADISYALPWSHEFASTPSTSGFWKNALTFGLGYRISGL